jgi:hypothetical protein
MQDLHELERVQRRRSGEAVPAPISMDVNLNSDDSGSNAEPMSSQSDAPGTATLEVLAGAPPAAEDVTGGKPTSAEEFWPNEPTDYPQS